MKQNTTIFTIMFGGSPFCALFILICLQVHQASAAHGPGFLNCYPESVRQRHFSINPGNYNPEKVTSTYCRERCGSFEYNYAAIAHGKFCFCSETLPAVPSAPEADCSMQCVGDASENCGSSQHVSVFDSIQPIVGLKVSSDVTNLQPTPATVSLILSIEKGRNVVYSADFGDGLGFTSKNETNFNTRTLYLPGEYTVTVEVTDDTGILQPSYAVTGFELEAPVKDVEVICDPVFATYEEGECEVIVWRGSSLAIDASVQSKPSSDIQNAFIADPEVAMVGIYSWAPDSFVYTASNVFLLHSSQFSHTGKIYGWRAHIQATGTIDLMVLTPVCNTGVYCYETNTCKASCFTSATTSMSTQCPATEPFCMQKSMCDASCTAAPPRFGVPFKPDKYSVKQIVTITATATGTQWFDQNPVVEVEAGDIIGLHEDGNGRISPMTSTYADITVTYAVPGVGTEYAQGDGTGITHGHALQALVSAGSKTTLKYTFNGEAGTFPLNVTVTNRKLAVSAKGSTMVNILEGVDQAIIVGPVFLASQEPHNFTLEEHTGTNLTYEWNVTDGSPTFYGMNLSHTFTAPGEYNISVGIYNVISRKENFTTVIVQDKIQGLTLNGDNSEVNIPVPFTIGLTAGNDYTCTLDFGDGSPVSVTDASVTVIPTSVQSHTYTSKGAFFVSVTVKNNVSMETTNFTLYIEERITNLRLAQEGAAKNTDFRLVWQVDTGSNITFDLEFGGVSVALDPATSTPLTNRWESVVLPGRGAGGYPYVLNATNSLGIERITGIFIILDEIVNPTFTSDLNDVTTEDTVTFTVDMDEGSDVTIVLNYQDGSPNTTWVISPPGAPWAAPVTLTHDFINGCQCQVTAEISNAAGSHTLTVEVLVKVNFGHITWDLPDFAYYLYNPPSMVSFQFSSTTGAFPTNPTIEIDWGDLGPVETYNTITYGPPGYSRQYDDTEDYTLKVTMSNILGSKTFIHRIVVVEKLVSPDIVTEFPSAPVNQPFNVTFLMFRGDQDNLTMLNWDFGDGNPPTVTERQGVGENGADTLPVIYTTQGTKTVTVTATAPLSQSVSATKNIQVIEGVIDSAVVVSTNGDVTLGAPTVFTIQYNAPNMPLNGKIKIDYFGDGSVISPPINFGIVANGGTQTETYTYTVDGVHPAKVIVYNDASEVVKEVLVGVYQPFANLKVAVSYKADSLTTNPVDQNGLQNAGNLYPIDRSIKFTLTDDNNAFATSYELTSTAGPVAVTEIFLENGFEYNFTVDGTYTFDITARNPVHTTTISRTFQVVKRVKGLSIVAQKSQIYPGQSKDFEFSFVEYGDDTCVYIDWGDIGQKSIYSNDATQCNDPAFTTATVAGNMTELTTELVGHRYLREGNYNMTIKAENAYGTDVFETSFPVSYFKCSKPAVSISYSETLFYKAPQHTKGSIIRLRGLASINCPDSLENDKSWFLHGVDSATGDLLPTPIDMTGLVTDKAELYIPARHLDIGLYKATYAMVMRDGSTESIFKDSAFTYFEVIESDITGVMVEGGMTEITRGTSQIIELEPLTWSIDPDMDPTAPQGLTVTNWVCEVLDTTNPADLATCGAVNTGAQSQSIAGGSFIDGLTYKITAYLEKGTRKTQAEIKVIMKGVNPPQAIIRCLQGSVCYPQSDGYRAPESSRVSLSCDCAACTAAAKYEWTIYIVDYRWLGGMRPLKYTDISERSISAFSQELALESDLFKLFADKTELFMAQCKITDAGNEGTVATNIYINRPPRGGSCSIQPLNTTCTVDGEKLWEIFCWDWTDEDSIKEFQFFSSFAENEVPKQITSYPTSQGTIRLNVSLPAGPIYRTYKQDIYVVVRDTKSAATTELIAEVQVRPPPAETLRNFVSSVLRNPEHDFFKVFQEADQRSVSEIASAVATLLTEDALQSREKYSNYEVASNLIRTGYGPYDADRKNAYKDGPYDSDEQIQYNFDKQRDDRAELRTSMVEHALDLSYEDAVSIQQVAGLLAQVTSEPTEITGKSQKLILNGLDEMLDNLLDPVKMVYTPQEDIEKAMNLLFSALGGVMEAAGVTGDYPTLTEMELARQDPSWKVYDTSIKSLGDKTDVSRAKSWEEADKLHTRNVHRVLHDKEAKLIGLQVTELMKKMVKLFNSFAIPGQVHEQTSFRLKSRIENNFAKNFVGRTIKINNSDAEVTLPDSLKELFPTQNIGEDDSLTFQIVQSTNYPDRYSDLATESIGRYTHFVTIDFFDANGGTINVDETQVPIRITIPNDVKKKIPENKAVRPLVTEWNQFQFHVTETEASGSSIHVKFEVAEGTQLAVAVRFDDVPKPSENETDFILLVPPTVPPDPTLENPYTIVLTNEDVAGRVGKWWFGTREREPQYINTSPPNHAELTERYEIGYGPFNNNYNVTIWATGCYFLKEGNDDWSDEGCVVGRGTSQNMTECFCSHLTTFAGGFVVAPNVIDWNYVFSNADFLSNPTLYLTEMFIILAFCVAFYFARKKDKRDAEKLGLAPLCDNDPRDKYYYEITVSTGMRRNAGTDSKVFFIMSGEEDETDVRMFSDSKRPIFKRGMTNGFLMAVPECLGRINYIRVWHDNTGRGKFGSWYMNYIVVKDLQTDTKQIFIANRWFALEEDDGQIDRIIPVAGKEQLEDFSYNFGERSKKNLADGHLWFSIIARPPASRFTCVQRVACCLCLLFMTMLANAMFYNVEDNNSTSSSTSFEFGPFSMSASQLFIGFISTMIVFPVNFLLVFLFRKAQPRYKRGSKVTLAPQSDNQRPGTAKLSQVNPHIQSDDNGMNRSTSSLQLPDRNNSPSASNDQARLVNNSSPAGNSPTPPVRSSDGKKSKSCMLPWWCRYVAWALLVVCTLGSAVLVTFYGITFADAKCKKWITSLIISFFTSIFITQPIKVILTAIFLSLIIKNPGEDEEEEDDTTALPMSSEDEFLHSMNDSSMAATRPKKIGYQPPDSKQLEKIRQQRLKEVKMWSVIREIIFYSVFVWILLVISHRNRGPDMYNYKNTMVRTFIYSRDTDINFEKIGNTNEFWTWAKSGFLNGIMAGSYYNLFPPLRLRTYINDKASRILGHATLRQLRIKPGKCEVPEYFNGIIPECNVLYSIAKEEDTDFAIGWVPLNASEGGNDTRPEYRWSTADSLNGYPYWGRLGLYSGGGYVVHLNGTRDEVKETIERLEKESWIDRYTRAVFIEFTVYNPQVNLFSVNMLVSEFATTNGIVPSYRFEPAMLLPYMTTGMVFQIVCELVFVAFIIGFIIVEITQLIKLKTKYFFQFWSWIEIAIISMSVTAIFIYFYRLMETNQLTEQFKEASGNEYIKFQYVGYWNEIFSYIIGFLVYLATLKFLRLLRFNKRISMLASTLKHSGKSLFHFSIIFWIVFLAFCQLFFLTFMNIDEKYSSFIESVVASILMMMGKFNIYDMIMAEPILTQIFVLLYVVSVTFVIVNMFVSILNDTFSTVREDVRMQSNDYEILEFMMGRFKKWTGLGTPPGSQNLSAKKDMAGYLNDDGDGSDDNKEERNYDPDDPMGPHMAVFPSRIDRLLHSLSAIYRDNDNDDHGSRKMTPGEFSLPPLPGVTKQPYKAPSGDHRPLSKAEKRRASLARVDTT